VKCNESHLTANCQKSSDQPLKRILCEGQHPASYPDSFYKYIQSKRKTFLTTKVKSRHNNPNTSLEQPIGNNQTRKSE